MPRATRANPTRAESSTQSKRTLHRVRQESRASALQGMSARQQRAQPALAQGGSPVTPHATLHAAFRMVLWAHRARFYVAGGRVPESERDEIVGCALGLAYRHAHELHDAGAEPAHVRSLIAMAIR